MDRQLLRLFQREALLQCRFILRAAAEIDRAISTEDSDGVVFALQNLLNAAANASKAFWGLTPRAHKRRRPLRESVDVADDSPLRDREIRNNLEHLDERLDKWWAESPNHNHVGLLVGPLGKVDAGGSRNIFRHYDPVLGVAYFWESRADVRAIVAEATRLEPKLEAEAAKPHWDPADLPKPR